MTPKEARTLGEAFRMEMRRLFQEQMCCGPYGPAEERDPLKFALTAFGARVFAGVANSLGRYAEEMEKVVIQRELDAYPFDGSEDGK